MPRLRVARSLRCELLEDRRLLAVDWRNPVDSLDVSADGFPTALDALRVIGELTADGGRRLPDQRDPGWKPEPPVVAMKRDAPIPRAPKLAVRFVCPARPAFVA